MNTDDRTEDSRTTQERGSGFTAAIWLAGCLVAGTIGYQYGYQTRDAEKAKVGYVVKSVSPITGKETEMWIIP